MDEWIILRFLKIYSIFFDCDINFNLYGYIGVLGQEVGRPSSIFNELRLEKIAVGKNFEIFFEYRGILG